MPWLVAVALSGLVQLAASMVGRVLIAAGVGVVSYMGIDTLIAQVSTDIWGQLGGLNSTVRGVFGMLRIGACINVLLSAYVIRMTLAGLGSGGAVKRWVTK